MWAIIVLHLLCFNNYPDHISAVFPSLTMSMLTSFFYLGTGIFNFVKNFWGACAIFFFSSVIMNLYIFVCSVLIYRRSVDLSVVLGRLYFV